MNDDYKERTTGHVGVAKTATQNIEEESRLERIVRRLETLMEDVNFTTNATNNAMDKLVGAYPETQEDNKELRSEPNGIVELIENRIDLLTSSINRQRQASQRIEDVL